MPEQKHIRHSRRHFGFSYPVSLVQRLYSIVFVPLLVVLISFIVLRLFSIFPVRVIPAASLSYLWSALLATFLRLCAAYILALVAAIPLALLVVVNGATERLFLPFFDVIESIPFLAFFPIIILFFIRFDFLNGAAVFILFLTMVWNIVFNVIGGLKVIPSDIKSAAQVFRIRGFSYLRKVLLPAVFPYVITGSLLAWAQGWNIIIVAEVFRTYIPGAQDLFGIGSVLVNAVASGNNGLFLGAIAVMILAIAFLNFFVWQKLLRYAERYKFE